MDFISPEVKQQLQQNQVNRQIEINASKMQFDSRAEQVAYYLYEEIRDYYQTGKTGKFEKYSG